MKERPWLRRAVWLAASGGLTVGLYLFWVENSALRASSETTEFAAKAALLSAERALDAGEPERQQRPDVEVLTQTGHLHARADRWEEAAAAYEEALALAPDDINLLKWTGLANRHLDRLERVRELLERQVELQPDVAVYHLRLADISKRLGDDEAAIRHQRDAVALDPGARPLRNDLAWALATSRDEQIRDPAEAIRLAEVLVQEAQTPDPNELDTLAAAYASAGRFDEAVRTALQAASLADERGQAQLSEAIRSRLELYRSQRPYVSAEASNGV